jgi:hypothetical protein
MVRARRPVSAALLGLAMTAGSASAQAVPTDAEQLKQALLTVLHGACYISGQFRLGDTRCSRAIVEALTALPVWTEKPPPVEPPPGTAAARVTCEFPTDAPGPPVCQAEEAPSP